MFKLDNVTELGKCMHPTRHVLFVVKKIVSPDNQMTLKYISISRLLFYEFLTY